LALPEERGFDSGYFDCWPPQVSRSASPKKLLAVRKRMEMIWNAHIKRPCEPSRHWVSLEFPVAGFPTPEFLWLKAINNGIWMAILRPDRPLLWIVHTGDRDGTGCEFVSDFGGRPNFPGDTRAMGNYYREFCKRKAATEIELERSVPVHPRESRI
jgi:hypothetical protein